jgi:hypothetical protein
MGSTLHVRLCPHKVWRDKYGCSKCDALDLAAYERDMRPKPPPDHPTEGLGDEEDEK